METGHPLGQDLPRPWLPAIRAERFDELHLALRDGDAVDEEIRSVSHLHVEHDDHVAEHEVAVPRSNALHSLWEAGLLASRCEEDGGNDQDRECETEERVDEPVAGGVHVRDVKKPWQRPFGRRLGLARLAACG